MITYNKLIRDNIPQIIEASGKKCKTRILNEKEFLEALKNKLIEESKELVAAKTDDEIIGEVIDIYELLGVLIQSLDIKESEIKFLRKWKNNHKGGFNKRIFLEHVE